MGTLYISITKAVDFQGRREEFDNVYLVEHAADNSESAGQRLINAFAAAEKPAFATFVEFVKGRAYTVGPLGTGETFAAMDLDGFGGNAASGVPYRECAYLIKWPLPRKSTNTGGLGRQRRLSKWYRTCSAYGGDVSGGSPLTATQRQFMAELAARIDAIADADIVAPDGTPPNAPPIVHPYLEHRQFPRGRKEG